MPVVAVSLGASFGDREEAVRKAWACARAVCGGQVVGVSRVYETAAVGGVARRPFLNAVGCVRTELPAERVRAELARIEAALGRRPARRWADRRIDLDVLLYGGAQLRSPTLEVPHPRLAERPFLLAMLYEAWPDAPNPWTGLAWRVGLPAAPPRAVVGVLERAGRSSRAAAVARRHPAV